MTATKLPRLSCFLISHKTGCFRWPCVIDGLRPPPHPPLAHSCAPDLRYVLFTLLYSVGTVSVRYWGLPCCSQSFFDSWSTTDVFSWLKGRLLFMNVCFLAWLKEKRVGETSFEMYRQNKNVNVSSPGIFYSYKARRSHQRSQSKRPIDWHKRYDTIRCLTSPQPNNKSWLETTSIYISIYHQKWITEMLYSHPDKCLPNENKRSLSIEWTSSPTCLI